MEIKYLSPRQKTAPSSPGWIAEKVDYAIQRINARLNQTNAKLEILENTKIPFEVSQSEVKVEVQVPVFDVQEVTTPVQKPIFSVYPSIEPVQKPVFDIVEERTIIRKPVFKVEEKELVVEKPVFAVAKLEVESLKRELKIEKWLIVGLFITELVQIAAHFIK